MENIIHETLEGSWGIGEAKWHHHPLKEAIVCLKGSFPFIIFSDPD
jgi:hypothetical protein